MGGTAVRRKRSYDASMITHNLKTNLTVLLVFAATPVLCQGQGTSPNQGLYFDPAFISQGFGIGVSERDAGPDALTLTWYTYSPDGAPVWYLGTGDLLDNRSSVVMSRFVLALDGAVDSSIVGSIDLEFVTPDRASLSFTLNGESGTQHIQRILPANTDATSTIQTGLWFPPAVPGWGMNWLKEGTSEAAILYIYDEAGQPVWVITDAVENDRANLLLFSGGNCPTCSAATPEFSAEGVLDREFLSATEAVGSVELVTDAIAWQMPDTSLTTLTATVDPLTESLEEALYGGDYATGGKPAEVIDAALAALLGGVAGPGGKGAPCLTTATVPAVLGIPLPSSFSVTMTANGNCELPNGEIFSGSLELNVEEFSLGLTGLGFNAAAIFNDFRRNGLLIADGPVAIMGEAGGLGDRIEASVTVVYDQVLTGSGVADGVVAAELTGLSVTPGPADQLLSGQIINGYLFTFDGFTLDGSGLDGSISIIRETTVAGRVSEISAELETAQGVETQFTVTIDRMLGVMNDQNVLILVLNTVGAARFGPYSVAFNDLTYVPSTCTYYPVSGVLTASGPGLDVTLNYDGNCSPPN